MTTDNGARELAYAMDDADLSVFQRNPTGPDKPVGMNHAAAAILANGAAFLPDAAELDRLRRIVLWAADELTRTTGDGEVNDTRIGEVVSALRATLAAEGSE